MYEHKPIDDPKILDSLEFIRSELELINKFVSGGAKEAQHSPKALADLYDKRIIITFPLLDSIHRAARDVAFLATHDSLTNAYVLGRVLVERSITYCFLLCCDESDFDSWVRHSRQKAFRLLRRKAKAGGAEFEFSVAPTLDPEQIPGLQDDLKSFTSERGRELTHWTQLSLTQRIDIAADRTPDFGRGVVLLVSALATIYDVGSEAIHGTLYGVGFTQGLYQAPQESMSSQIIILLASVLGCLDASLTALGKSANDVELVERTAGNYSDFLKNNVVSG